MSTNFRLKAISIIGQRKTFYWQRIPESSYSRKKYHYIDMLVTSRNGDKKSCNLSEYTADLYTADLP